MNENDIIQAKNVFEMAKGALDDNKWKYDHNDEKMWISCTANSDDLPIDIFVQVFPKNQLIVLTSRIPVKVPEEKMVDAALAVAMINSNIADGSFDLDIYKGVLEFRMTGCFLESLVSRGFFDYMMVYALKVVDEYNDKLFALVKGYMDINKFAEQFTDNN